MRTLLVVAAFAAAVGLPTLASELEALTRQFRFCD